MTQLSLWSDDSQQEVKQTKVSHKWKLFIDGASKKNPGPAGAGFSLHKEDEAICQQGFFLGIKTNNQAEYLALLLGIFFAKKYVKTNDHLTIISDSQLLVRQMNGLYRVKDVALRQLQQLAAHWLKGCNVEIEHVLREFNTTADELANRGVSKKISLPKDFIDRLQAQNINL